PSRRQPCGLAFEQLPDIEDLHEGFRGEGTDRDTPLGLLVDEPFSLQTAECCANGRAGGLQPPGHSAFGNAITGLKLTCDQQLDQLLVDLPGEVYALRRFVV